MKKGFSLFKNRQLSLKPNEEAMLLLHSSYHKILKVNLKKDSFDEIRVYEDEHHSDKGYSRKFSEWLRNFAMTGNIHKDDINEYLDFIDLEKIRKAFSLNKKKISLKYRRFTNNEMRWVSMDMIPSKNFSEKNQFIFVYVYDIHDALSDELYTTKLMSSIAHAITKSFICCVYLDLDNDTTKLIYAKDTIRSHVDESISMRALIRKSIENFIDESYHSKMLNFCNFDTLSERLRDKKSLTMEFIGVKGRLCRASFLPVILHRDGRLKSVVYATQFIEGELLNLRDQLETEKTLVECLTALTGSEDFDKATRKLLETIGKFYDADKAYIFNFDFGRNLARKDYEWCRKTDDSEDSGIHEIPLSTINRWFTLFEKNDCVRIENASEELDPDSNEAMFLEKQGTKSIFAVPFRNAIGNVTGYIGVNNPGKNMDAEIVLRSVATYVMEEMLKKNYTDELYKLSYFDIMTETYNRAAYIRDMNLILKEEDHPAGILYADVNGLKQTNDTMGHEAGDHLIKNAVSLLKKYFYKKADSIYRLGGDEFVVLSSDISEKEFLTRVCNLKDELEHNWILSCGGTWFKKISDIDQATKEAEKAMYRNKSDFYTANPRTDRRQ